ncbi:hypothetical protein BaRGS_00033750, partial [Batillaria attramentaria]
MIVSAFGFLPRGGIRHVTSDNGIICTYMLAVMSPLMGGHAYNLPKWLFRR